MTDWLSKGTARRTRVQRFPIIHALVQDTGEWVMWCTSGKAEEDNPLGTRFCRECRQLVHDAVANGDLDPEDVQEWGPFTT